MGALAVPGPEAGPLDGRYELGERLGTGGTADVLRATDLQLGRQVAVKMFRPGSDPALEARFADEAGMLARLQHPGLVTVYDAGFDHGRAYLVMQLVEGESLRSRLTDTTQPPQAVRRMGRQLADALVHVHAAGIVHRDVKPSNILLDSGDQAHLTDFGIARLTDATTHTQSGMFTGTAAYMAPEQVRGDRPGPPADIYALGLVLLQCLTGRLEYEGTPLESAVARLHRPPAIPSETPAALHDLITAMTRTEPEARPDATTCARWLGDERDSPHGALPRAAPALSSGPGHRAGGKRRLTLVAPLAVLTVVLAMLAAGLTLTASSPDSASRHPRHPAPATPTQAADTPGPEQQPPSSPPSTAGRHTRPTAAATPPPASAPAAPAGKTKRNNGRAHHEKPHGQKKAKGRPEPKLRQPHSRQHAGHRPPQARPQH